MFRHISLVSIFALNLINSIILSCDPDMEKPLIPRAISVTKEPDTRLQRSSCSRKVKLPYLDELLGIFNILKGQPVVTLTADGKPVSRAHLFDEFRMRSYRDCQDCKHLKQTCRNLKLCLPKKLYYWLTRRPTCSSEWEFNMEGQGLTAQQAFTILRQLVVKQDCLTYRRRGFNFTAVVLTGQDFSDDYPDLPELFKSQSFANLRLLTIADSRMWDPTLLVTSLARSLQFMRNLEELNLTHNYFYNDDENLSLLARGLINLHQLKRLILPHNAMSVGFSALGLAFPYLANLEELDLDDNALCYNQQEFQSFAQSLKSLKKLRILRMNTNTDKAKPVSVDALAAMGRSLASNGTLRLLDISNNQIGREGFEGLAQSFPYLPLEELNISGLGLDESTDLSFVRQPGLKKLFVNGIGWRGAHNKLSPTQIQDLREFWGDRPRGGYNKEGKFELYTDIFVLNTPDEVGAYFAALRARPFPVAAVSLSGMVNPTDDVLQKLAEELTDEYNKNSIRIVDLSRNGITNGSILGKALAELPNLEEVDFSYNLELGQYGFTELITGLQGKEHLRVIKLNYVKENNATDMSPGAMNALAQVFRTSRNIIEIRLGTNYGLGLDSAGIGSMLESINQLKQLQILDLQVAELLPEQIQTLAKALAIESSQLVNLNLYANKLDVHAAQALAKVLPHLPLKILNLWQVGLGSDGVESVITLAHGIAGLVDLEELYLWQNYIGTGKDNSGVIALADAIAQLKKLRRLYLSLQLPPEDNFWDKEEICAMVKACIDSGIISRNPKGINLNRFDKSCWNPYDPHSQLQQAWELLVHGL